MSNRKKVERNISIDERGNYYACCYFKGQKKTYVKCKTLKEARETLALYKADKIRKEVAEPTKDTVADLMDFYLNNIVSLSCRENTLDHYRKINNKYITPILGSKKFQDVDYDDIINYINKVKKMKIKNVTINKHLDLLRGAFKNAKKRRKINYNVMQDIDNLKIQKVDIKFYPKEDVKKMLECAKNTHLELPLTLLSYTGMRQSELNGLTWDDVDWEKETITINRSRTQTGKNAYISDTKTTGSQRTLALTKELIDLLKKEQLKQKENKLLFGPAWGKSLQNPEDDNKLGHIFVKENGSLYRPEYLSKEFPKFLKKNNLVVTNLHSLRHSVATYLISLGMDVKEVQQILGHTKASTTLDIYAGTLDKNSRQAIKNLTNLYQVETK